jgi:hypothetical protein
MVRLFMVHVDGFCTCIDLFLWWFKPLLVNKAVCGFAFRQNVALHDDVVGSKGRVDIKSDRCKILTGSKF